ncbi:MAG: DNA-processing protein DprA [Patescibacteria group bacterium]
MEKIYLHALNLISHLNYHSIRRLLSIFGSAQNIWLASSSELQKVKISKQGINSLIRERYQIDPEHQWNRLIKEQVEIVTFLEDSYPPLLKEIHSPPVVLYVKGNTDLKNKYNLAIVGTRKNSAYSQRILEQLLADLTQYFVIVSGLALGVDAIAHQQALYHNGKTVAVLGCGLDQIYPRSNYNLAEEILDKDGSLISEYPLGTEPFKQHFPARNRLISGMSLGTLVVEAPLRSGALITAAFSLEQNREVFAVPGSVFSPKSQGTNQLIQMGAKCVLSAHNILETYNLDLTKNKNKIILKPTTTEEKIIWQILSNEPTTLDKIIAISKLETRVVNSTLISLELKGSIKNLGGQNYVINQ